MESQPQNPEFRNNPETITHAIGFVLTSSLSFPVAAGHLVTEDPSGTVIRANDMLLGAGVGVD